MLGSEIEEERWLGATDISLIEEGFGGVGDLRRYRNVDRYLGE